MPRLTLDAHLMLLQLWNQNPQHYRSTWRGNRSCMSTSTASTTAFFLSLSSGCCTRKHHFHFNPSMFIYRLQNMMGKAWRKMRATARSSTYRRWRRRTDSSSVLHLLPAAHFCDCLALCRRGEKEAQGEATMGERSREGAPEQHCSKGVGEE
jgi:hypothetical protein